MLSSALFHDLHDQLIGITGTVGTGINRSKLMLTGSCLVMLGLGENT